MLPIFRNLFAPPRHLILLVIAAWIGLILAEKKTERNGVSRIDLSNLAFYGVIALLLGGRLTFALQNIPAFAKSPLDLFSINPDLFDPWGGLSVAILAGYIYGQKQNLLLWPVLDALTPVLAILAAGFGFSHLAAGTAFGSPSNLPWGIELWNAIRHPTQLYEILASIVIFVFLWFKRQDPRPGLLFLAFAGLTAGSQVFIQAFRGDSTLIWNGLKQEQVIAWMVLAISLVLIEVRINSNQAAGRNSAARDKQAPRSKV